MFHSLCPICQGIHVLEIWFIGVHNRVSCEVCMRFCRPPMGQAVWFLSGSGLLRSNVWEVLLWTAQKCFLFVCIAIVLSFPIQYHICLFPGLLLLPWFFYVPCFRVSLLSILFSFFTWCVPGPFTRCIGGAWTSALLSSGWQFLTARSSWSYWLTSHPTLFPLYVQHTVLGAPHCVVEYVGSVYREPLCKRCCFPGWWGLPSGWGWHYM